MNIQESLVLSFSRVRSGEQDKSESPYDMCVDTKLTKSLKFTLFEIDDVAAFMDSPICI